jgi:uncharacterized cysteine cluster protein YcgN (CxxCxxCC family)
MRHSFWERFTLDELTSEEWEALCDGCALCCLHHVEDDDEQIHRTAVACRLLDVSTCKCSNYAEREVHVPECLTITPDSIGEYTWLPETCGYRRLANGEPLPWWHPLVVGHGEEVHEQGISCRGWALSEEDVHPDDIVYYLLGVGGGEQE